MKVAIIGSRTITIENIEDYIPKNTTEIISGGAKGVDSCARLFAVQNNMPYTEFLPDYKKYGRAAPIVRNRLIVDSADIIIAFWNGTSKGTKSVIDYCNKAGKKVQIYNV
ncbi:MAG: hypothetical protein IKJ27_05560 [Clostridia bacterium]|nr:hypothetical protein [Clostridia bacterium]